MKISEMIKNLHEFMNEHGDIYCYYASDDEGNEFHPVSYKPSLMCVLKYSGEVMTHEDAGWREEDPDDCEDICVVN